MAVNKKKLVFVSAIPVFVALLWAYDLKAPSLSQAYFAGRIEEAEAAYAASQNTTVTQLVAKSMADCERQKPICIQEEQKKPRSSGGILFSPEAACNCVRPLLAWPQDTIWSHVMGIRSAFQALTPILASAVAALGLCWLSIIVIPRATTRFWRWLNI